MLDGDPPVHAGAREIPFDMNHARRAKRKGSIVISGGLTVDTVAAAIKACRPYGVEVSTSVESVQGMKDSILLQRFVEACKSA